MENLFVTFNQANCMKNLGYFCNEPFKVYNEKDGFLLDEKFCIYANIEYIPAPLKQRAFEWFRHKYNLLCFIDFSHEGKYYYIIRTIHCKDGYIKSEEFITYKKAENNLIDKLIYVAQRIEKNN